MDSWIRYPINAALPNSIGAGTNVDVTSSPYTYYTDQLIGFFREVNLPKIDGTYMYRTHWVRASGSPPGGHQAIDTRIIVETNAVENTITYTIQGRAGTTDDIGSRPFSPIGHPDTIVETIEATPDPVPYTLKHGLTPLPNFNILSVDSIETGVTGEWGVTLFYYENGSLVSSEFLDNLDYRAFALLNPRMDKYLFDHSNPTEEVHLTVDVYALPGSSGWTPDGDIEYLITLNNISEPGSPTVRSQYGLIVDTSFTGPDSNGKFATITMSWDGTDTVGDPVFGMIDVRITAVVPVAGGKTISTDRTFIRACPPGVVPVEDEDVQKYEVKCDEPYCGMNRFGYYVVQTTVANDFASSADLSLSLTNQGADSAKLPCSFGYGWGLNKSDRVFYSSTGDKLVHISGSGHREAWDVVGSTFTPTLEYNYTTVSIDPIDDSITLTSKDKVQRKFHPFANTETPGVIEWMKDRNGNTTYFHYARGLLVAFSEKVDGNGNPDGRTTLFVYPNNGVQPNYAVSQLRDSETVLAERVTTFAYFDTTNISLGYLAGRLGRIVNAAGENQDFRYYANSSDYRFGKLYRIIDPRGAISVELDYYNDTNVRLKSQTNFNFDGTNVVAEKKAEFTYGTNTVTVVTTDLTGKSTPPTRTSLFTYDGTTNNLVQMDQTIGSVTNTSTMEYLDDDNPYLLTKSTDPNLEYVENTYTGRGNIETMRDKRGHVTTLEYYSGDPDLVRYIKRPFVTVPDPNNPGLTLSEQYQTEFFYDAKANLNGIKDALGRTTHLRLRNGVDHAATDGKVWKIIDRRWDGNPLTEEQFATVMTYYPNGNLESIETPGGPDSHPARKAIFEYDDFDNVVKVTDLLGNESTVVRDDLDRPRMMTDARGKTSYFGYEYGFLTLTGAPPNLGPSGPQSLDIGQPSGARITLSSYDYAGRLERVESHDSETTLQTRVEQEYNGFSELVALSRQINGHNKTMEWTYDQLGRAVELRDTLGRITSRDYEPFCVGFTETTPRGITKTTSFDALCRPQMVTASSEEHEFEYDELGRLIEVRQKEQARYSDPPATPPLVRRRFGSAKYYTPELVPGKTWRFWYDALDRVTNAFYPDGEEVSFEYGHEGELLRRVDSDEKATRYEYNNDLSLKKVIIERGGADVGEFVYSYDVGGRLYEVHYPEDSGIQIHFHDGAPIPVSGWDANGALTLVRYVKDDGLGGFDLVRSFAYSYDDSGNRISALESNGNAALDIEWQYRYDWFDRLVQVKRRVGVGTLDLVREYVFDESDNRKYLDDYINGRTFWYTYKTVVDGSQTLYSDELAEVLVASTMAGERTPANFTSMETFVNDPDGNTISRTNSAGTVTYDWDDFNNLLAVKLDTGEVTQHLYGSDSIRKERVRDNEERVKSYYAGMSTSNESSTNASGNASYLMGHQLLGLERNGNFLYFVSDGLSSVRAVLDDQGDVVSTFEHDEYGNEMSMTGLPSPKTYVGGLGVHNDVGDTGLLYMRRRHYDPTLGRFLSADPIGLAGGLNVYEYAGTNPVTFVDPEGLLPLGGVFGDLVQAHLSTIVNPPRLVRPTGKPFLNRLPQDKRKTGWMIPCQVQTENGGWVDIFYHVKTKGSNPAMDSNCHGQTFLGGEFILQPDKLSEFLLGDRWAPFDPQKSPLKVGDAIIINKPGDAYMHSERVIGPGLVFGESGMEPPRQQTVKEATSGWPEGTIIKYYRKY